MFRKIYMLGMILFIMGYGGAAMAFCTSLEYGEACNEWHGLDLSNYRADSANTKDMCGKDGRTGATGFQYVISYDGADDGCLCNISDDPHMNFYWGFGCYCDDGYYTVDDRSTKCTKCPSDHPLSDGFSMWSDTQGGANNWGNDMDACYRVFSRHDGYASVKLKEYTYDIYSSDWHVLDMKCDTGYYTDDDWHEVAYYDEYYHKCYPVGEEYYSAENNTRQKCPTYVNAAGQMIAGRTSGAGAGAASITDCTIPESEVFSDATGQYVYHGGCKYSK